MRTITGAPQINFIKSPSRRHWGQCVWRLQLVEQLLYIVYNFYTVPLSTGLAYDSLVFSFTPLSREKLSCIISSAPLRITPLGVASLEGSEGTIIFVGCTSPFLLFLCFTNIWWIWCSAESLCIYTCNQSVCGTLIALSSSTFFMFFYIWYIVFKW